MAGVLTLTGSPLTYTEPLTTTEVKEWLRISDPSPADAAFDVEIDSLIQAAREKAEYYQNLDIATKQWDLTLDSFGGGSINLRKPLVSVDLVTYKDSDGTTTTLTVNTDYIVDLKRGLIMPPYGGSWPSFTAWPTSAVTVRFTSGSAPPKLIELGMLNLIEYWFTGKAQNPINPNLGEVPPAIINIFRHGSKETSY